MSHSLGAYLPQDRLAALATGRTLPEQAIGTVLFADISGFTPLTETLTALGVQRGAEALIQQINRIYGALTAQAERWHGSVIGFSGDGITCWFDQATGPAAPHAAACALAMQQTIARLSQAAQIELGITLALRITIASGSARRFVVGDPRIQLLDVLAGALLDRVAAVDQQGSPGEVLIDVPTAEALGDAATLEDWRGNLAGDARCALLTGLRPLPPDDPWPALAALDPETLRPWLLPAVYERACAGLDHLLTELRPMQALFVRFTGIDYECEHALPQLNRLICGMQQLLQRYGGTLLQLTIGDKGSYVYAGFGAPVAHEDDARRAVQTALELEADLGGAAGRLQIGVSSGLLLAGPYGGPTRRSYTATGDPVNLAARLMMRAAPGQILATGRVQHAVGHLFDMEPHPPIRLKGKAEPLVVFSVTPAHQRRALRLEEPLYALPLIGRDAELRLLAAALAEAHSGYGRVVGIQAEAGLGKSRLISEAVRLAHQQHLVGYGGACHALGANTPYLVWQPIWRAFFDIDPQAPARRQTRALTAILEDFAPERLEALPLLGPLLGITLPENEFTRTLAPRDRQRVLHMLLGDVLAGAAREQAQQGRGLLLVLEDVHWIDAASADLLADLTGHLGDLPALIIVSYRPSELRLRPLKIEALPIFQRITLDGLAPGCSDQLVRAKLALLFPARSETVPQALVDLLIERAQGNPFYLEEVLNYLHDRAIDPSDTAALAALELPDSLYALVHSRLDRLSPQQQLVIKTASVIGRRFPVHWLQGILPPQAQPGLAHALETLAQAELLAADPHAGEPAYLFRHVVTQDATYTSLSQSTRQALHGQLAVYLEAQAGDAPEALLDLLAYHYDRSTDLAKRRIYLRRAAEAAATHFANAPALDYLARALALAPEDDLAERYELLLIRVTIVHRQHKYKGGTEDLLALLRLANQLGDDRRRSTAVQLQAQSALMQGEAATLIAAAQELIQLGVALDDPDQIAYGYAAWAFACYDRGDSAAAQRMAQMALDVPGMSEHCLGSAGATFTLGELARQQGRFAEAVALIQASIVGFQAIGDRYASLRSHAALAQLTAMQGDMAGVAVFAEQTLAISRLIGDPQGEAIAFGHLGAVALWQGELGQARTYLDHSLAIARTVGDIWSESSQLCTQAEWLLICGDPQQALECYKRALELKRAMRNRWSESVALALMALLLHQTGDDRAALVYASQGLALAREMGTRPNEALALLAQGHALAALDRTEEASSAYGAALDLRQALGQRHLAAEVRAGLARLALEQGRSAEAQAHAEAILTQLTNGGLHGTHAPLRTALVCLEVLTAADDSRAQTLLDDIYADLMRRADSLGDGMLRQRFLEQPDSQAVLRLAGIAEDVLLNKVAHT
ncbi:MAG TPA: adenylate/guanylate cyclase domain-containing protein [Roseiflexaceae bacterium]|nr:adenylate/guanylate cyclase domain-containing protein [Roseiflexaceae bacterium]